MGAKTVWDSFGFGLKVSDLKFWDKALAEFGTHSFPGCRCRVGGLGIRACTVWASSFRVECSQFTVAGAASYAM